MVNYGTKLPPSWPGWMDRLGTEINELVMKPGVRFTPTSSHPTSSDNYTVGYLAKGIIAHIG